MSYLAAPEIQGRSDLLEWTTAARYRHFDAYTCELCRGRGSVVVPIDVEAEHPDILFPISRKDPRVATPATSKEAGTRRKRRMILHLHKEFLVLQSYTQHDRSQSCDARATEGRDRV
jgi:hypothetical protein